MDTVTDVLEIDMTEIERRYAPGPGRHWFDPDTMRFFRSRLPKTGFEGPGGVYFVSSELPAGGSGYTVRGRRAYKVRRLTGPGKIDTVGPFCEYTRAVAWRLARQYAAEGVSS